MGALLFLDSKPFALVFVKCYTFTLVYAKVRPLYFPTYAYVFLGTGCIWATA